MQDQNQSETLQGKGQSAKERFSSSGFILAAIGSAVGLGNMWKFPYITGQYGGAAFFLLFVICLLLVGLPVLLAELAVGRGGRGNASTSLIRLSGHKLWGGFGFITILGAFVILSFYAVVAGWTLHYAMLSFTGELFKHSDFGLLFSEFNNSWMPVAWQFIVLLLTGFIIMRGVSAGIERFNKILIPGLVILLVVLCIRALSLEGAGEGAAFFLKPDFSKLTAESALVALGHAFFSLSLGMGAMMTYGAYVDKRQSLGLATLAIGAGDLIYAFLAGLIIFPTTFVFGLEASQGPSLVFVALPAAFSAMPFGAFFGGLFFVLLAFAALTSTVSLLEVPIAFVREAFGWRRSFSVIFLTLLCFLIGLPSALSLGNKVPWLTFGGKPFFDWMDFVCSNIVLPLGGLVVTLFVGYAWRGAAEEAGLSSWWLRLWLFMLRYVAPILVLLVFLYSSGIIRF
ncbi:sodium-dependent transporter [Paenibacillus sp. LPE1-1-1.1]|uniref:sodium-dependent transporter n=1 Tax=Paenibacillus sp. LPE1-1-1.1 TaxID=3135230 RepID=UPI003434033B